MQSHSINIGGRATSSVSDGDKDQEQWTACLCGYYEEVQEDLSCCVCVYVACTSTNFPPPVSYSLIFIFLCCIPTLLISNTE